MRYGFMFITVGMVLLLYEEEETRKVMLHYGGGWSVGCGVAILGLSLFSLSSLLFSDHVFYSTHLPASCFACFTTPALVTLFVSWWLFLFLFLLYFFSAFIAFYFGGWHVDMVG